MIVKYTFLVLVLLTGLSSPGVWASVSQEQETKQKRVEEQTRTSLQPTEAVIQENRPADKIILPEQAINQEYLKRLVRQAKARKVDAVYVVMVLLGKHKDFSSFEAQSSYLKQNGFFPKYEDGSDLNELLTKGELAFMLCKALKIKGGLHLRIFGLSERYALFELAHQRIMILGHKNEIVTGRELVYSFLRSSDFLKDRSRHEK